MKKLIVRQGNKTVKSVEYTKKSKSKKITSKAKIVKRMVNNNKPLINIITRTSGRPNGFKRCHESIKNQSYKNIRHIVSIDNLKDAEYVKKYDVDYYFIDKEKISAKPDIPDPKTGKRFIYNLYFNELISKIDNGWVLILDDDDYLKDKHSIIKIVNSIKHPTDMIIFQMKYPNGSMLPTINEMGKQPRLGRIGSPCILVHSAVAKRIKWDGWKCGDYRFISNVWGLTNEKRWIKEALISLGGAGFGLRKDIKNKPDVMINKKTKDGNKILENFQRKFVEKNTKGEVAPASPKTNLISKSSTENAAKDYYIDIIKPSVEYTKGRVLVVMSNYNRAKYITKSIDSVLNQEYDNILLHIIDDNSTDSSVGVIKKHLAKIKSKNVRFSKYSKNVGTYHHRNHALYINKFDYWTICDSDDVLLKGHIKLLMQTLKNNKKLLVAPKFKRILFKTNKQISVGYSEGCILYHKDILNKIGYYDYNRFGADTDYMWRAEKYFGNFAKTNEVTYIAYNYGDNLTIKHKKPERAKYVDEIKRYYLNKGYIRKLKLERHSIEDRFGVHLDNFIHRINTNQPFALARYGDGEMMIINNKPIDLTNKFNGEHKFSPHLKSYQKLRKEMTQSLKYKNNSYFVGLPCPCCVGSHKARQTYNISEQNSENVTWANIFTNNNYKRFIGEVLPAVKNKKVVLICHKKANTKGFCKNYNVVKEFRVGVNAWHNDYHLIEKIQKFSKTVDSNTVFLFMAGTFSNLAIYKIHKIRHDLFLIDLGSVLDLQFKLGATRIYLMQKYKNNNKKCKWITD